MLFRCHDKTNTDSYHQNYNPCTSVVVVLHHQCSNKWPLCCAQARRILVSELISVFFCVFKLNFCHWGDCRVNWNFKYGQGYGMKCRLWNNQNICLTFLHTCDSSSKSSSSTDFCGSHSCLYNCEENHKHWTQCRGLTNTHSVSIFKTRFLLLAAERVH